MTPKFTASNPTVLCFNMNSLNTFLKRFYLFLGMRREEEREEEEHQCVVASCTPPTGDLAHNPGMCPDWESNGPPFVSKAGAQSTEPHQPGLLQYEFSHVY